ncbi:MAG: hypothetical protein ACOCXP_01210 [Candidatus Dojkabacteria bacterium]
MITSPTDITILSLIRGVVSLLPGLIVMVFLGMLIYGGFVKMTAAGDPEKEKQSSQILTAAVVGFVIIVISPFVINILGRLLGIDNLLIG